jgi:hypothetical protein
MTVKKMLFDAQTVDASGNATSTDVIYTGNTDHLDIYVKNTGTSANCTIIIYGSSHKDKSFQREVQPFTLGTGEDGKSGVSVYEKSIPSWCWAKVINSGTSPAIVDVELEMW